MLVQRGSWLAGLVALLLAPRVFAAQGEVQRAGKQGDARSRVALGVLADAGVPDGANAALALRPARWLRLHLGGGHNTVSSGVRGGVGILPLGHGPSFNVEVGHYRDGNANRLVRGLVGSNQWLTPLFERIGYTYVNAQLGLELGRGNFQFFVHGGVSFLRSTIHNANAALAASNGGGEGPSAITVRFTRDPIVRAWIPSLKLGMVVYFGGRS